MNNLGIDMLTKHSHRMKKRLKKLVSVEQVDGPFQYWQQPTLCQMQVTTTMTLEELDDWLYTVDHKCEYVGTFVRRQ
jgi:hypothetical protein